MMMQFVLHICDSNNALIQWDITKNSWQTVASGVPEQVGSIHQHYSPTEIVSMT